jgi:deoxyribonuclease-1-like protein
VARFQTRTASGTIPFTFTLVNIHTDPDETDIELDALDDVFLAVQRNGSGEDDVILLGDLNVDEYKLGELGRLPGIGYVVSGTTTNTRRNRAYDNLVFHRGATTEYLGRWGVLDLEAEYGLTRDQALEVSDHLPVWAEFSPHELMPVSPVATRPAPQPR